jgi:hypothetical protein
MSHCVVRSTHVAALLVIVVVPDAGDAIIPLKITEVSAKDRRRLPSDEKLTSSPM